MSKTRVDFSDPDCQQFVKFVSIEKMNWKQLLNYYSKYSVLSDRTIREYVSEFGFFTQYAKANGVTVPIDVTRVFALSYRKWLVRCVAINHTYTADTAKKKMYAVSSIFSSLHSMGAIPTNPFDQIRFPSIKGRKEDVKKPFTKEVFEEMVDFYIAREQKKASPTNKRNITILNFARETGLRNTAIRTLNFEDITVEEKDGDKVMVIKYTNKGAHHPKQSVTYLGEGVAFDYFMAWANFRKKELVQAGFSRTDKQVIFPSYHGRKQNPEGKALTSQNLNLIVRAALNYLISQKNLVIDRKCYTFHSLRHMAGTEVTRAQGLEEAARVLGHTSTNTTKRYAEEAIQEQRKEATRDRATQRGDIQGEISN